MNIQQLRYILAVHEHRHFGRAAEACHVSQASLSAMIRKFENEHNIVVFDRSHQPIQTTSCGKDAITIIKRILEEVEDLQHYLAKADTVMKGDLRIGIIPTVASGLLPLVFEALEKHLPEVGIEFISLKTEDIWKALREEAIDAGIVATPAPRDEFQEYTLYYETLNIYGEIEKETAFELPLKLEDPQMWLLEEGHCLSGQARQICTLQSAKRAGSKLHMKAESLDTLMNLVDRKGGFTILPELYINQLPQERTNRVHGFNEPLPVREVSLVTWRERAKFRLVKGLRETICKHIQPTLKSASLQNNQMQVLDL